MREVRRLLCVSMGKKDLKYCHYKNFCERFKQENGLASKTSGPEFDAWCLVRGVSRRLFKEEKFFQRYPSAKEKIKEVRKKLELKIKEN